SIQPGVKCQGGERTWADCSSSDQSNLEQSSSMAKMLHYALWVDRTTAGQVRKEMPYKLMFGQNAIYLIETSVEMWAAIYWKYLMEREELLEARIWQLERHEEDIHVAQQWIRARD